MRKVSCIFLFFILTFLRTGLSASEPKITKNSGKGGWEGKKSLVLKEKLSIGVREGDKNLMFFEPTDVKVDRDGNIYVLDKGNFRIQKFDKNGRFLLTIGKKGQGPGEILECFDMELDSKGNILVFDSQNSRVTKFDPEGTFLTSFKLEYSAKDGAIDSEGNIYIYQRYKGKLIHKYDSNGKYLFSFMEEILFEPKRIEPHINALGNITVSTDKIYLAMIYPYTLFVFNKNGELLEKVITDVPYSQPPFLSPEGVVITNFVIAGLAVSPQGFIFVKAFHFDVPSKWKEKLQEILSALFKNSFLDIFDSRGVYLLHHKIPDFVWGITFDSEGYLYMIKQEEDYWRVVKYLIYFK